MMNIEFLTNDRFGNTTILAKIIISLTGFVTLYIPIRPIIRFISTTPTGMTKLIFTNIFIPTISRTKSSYFFSMISIFIGYLKSFTTEKTRFFNKRFSTFEIRFTQHRFTYFNASYFCHFFHFLAGIYLFQINPLAFIRTCLSMMGTWSDEKYLSTNNTRQFNFNSFTSGTGYASSRTIACLINASSLSVREWFSAMFTNGFNKCSVHILKELALSMSVCCLSTTG